MGRNYARSCKRTSENSPSETVWKIERSSSVTYAPEHEKDLCHRSYRGRMGGPRAPRSCSQQTGTTQDPHPTRDPQCRVLCFEEWLSLAATPSRFSALGDRLLVVRKMEDGRHLRAAQRRPARAVAGSFGQEPAPEREHSRLPNDQDYRGRRRAEGIRRQQEGPRQEAPPLGGHRRVCLEGQGAQRQGPGAGRTEAPTWVGAEWDLAPEAPVARRRIRGSR